MLKGRTAVITGGSRGIGREVAFKMAENGANVAIIYTGDGAEAEETVELCVKAGVQAKAYPCDVSDFARSKDVCELITGDFSGVDILVNNAGITKDALLLRMGEADFDAVIAVNLKGAFNFTKHLTRAIMKSPCGRIINISSVIGISGNAGQANYSASKAGLIGLTKSAAKELASRGVTCNAIAPGFIDTAMTASLSPEVISRAVEAIPLKRMGQAADVAETALFLASDAAAYITGEVIKVDGGMCI